MAKNLLACTGGADASGLTGYTIISATDLSAATEKAESCPVLTSGGIVEVYEALEMG